MKERAAEVIRIAVENLEADNGSAAFALSDAEVLFRAGNYHYAATRALTSVLYSKGQGPVYEQAKDAALGPLYRVALAADAAYSAELQRVYGRLACEKRYSRNHTDPVVIAALELKLSADRAWLEAFRLESGA